MDLVSEPDPDFLIETGYGTNKTSFDSKLDLKPELLFKKGSGSIMILNRNHPICNPSHGHILYKGVRGPGLD